MKEIIWTDLMDKIRNMELTVSWEEVVCLVDNKLVPVNIHQATENIYYIPEYDSIIFESEITESEKNKKMNIVLEKGEYYLTVEGASIRKRLQPGIHDDNNE